jgi:hypothetical protein
MKGYEVVLAPAAQAQARKVAAWWQENRPKAFDLFDEEMAAVLDTGRFGTGRSAAS